MPHLFRLLTLFVVVFGFAACADTDMENVEQQPPVPPTVSYDFQAPFNNISLHYTDRGQGKIPLIFVHGWGGHSDFWRKEIQDLSRDHRVIALDLPGHGESEAMSEPYTQQTLATSVLAVMNNAHVDKAVLVGHSMGANIVRHVALMAPERVAGLVLVDGAILFPPKGKKQLLAWEKEMKAFVQNFPGPEGEDFTRNFIASMHGRMTPQWVKDEVIDVVMKTPREVRVSAMLNFIDLSAWPRKKVMVPTLAVYARSTEFRSNLRADLRAYFPNLEFVLWDGPGHFFMLYKDARLDDQIRAYTKRHKF